MAGSARGGGGVRHRGGAEDDLRPRLPVAGCLALLALGACAPQAPERPDAGPSRPDATPPAPTELRLVSTRPRVDDYAALGLTGENKPNGMQYRLRQSVPAATPALVPRALDGLDLFIADPTPEGWLALYRTPLEHASLGPNARFRALLFSPAGERLWDLDLNRFLSRPDQLEVQDIRLQDGELYLNEGCQTYSRDAGGECSALLRLDPRRATVEWRTRPLVSSDIFILHGDHVVAGYGFTAEPDSLHLVERATGRVVDSAPLDSAHDYLEVSEGRLVVVTQSRVYTFELVTPRP